MIEGIIMFIDTYKIERLAVETNFNLIPSHWDVLNQIDEQQGTGRVFFNQPVAPIFRERVFSLIQQTHKGVVVVEKGTNTICRSIHPSVLLKEQHKQNVFIINWYDEPEEVWDNPELIFLRESVLSRKKLLIHVKPEKNK